MRRAKFGFALYYATYKNKTDINLHPHAKRGRMLDVATDDISTSC